VTNTSALFTTRTNNNTGRYDSEAEVDIWMDGFIVTGNRNIMNR